MGSALDTGQIEQVIGKNIFCRSSNNNPTKRKLGGQPLTRDKLDR
jgi:hypothetical protein